MNSEKLPEEETLSLRFEEQVQQVMGEMEGRVTPGRRNRMFKKLKQGLTG